MPSVSDRPSPVHARHRIASDASTSCARMAARTCARRMQRAALRRVLGDDARGRRRLAACAPAPSTRRASSPPIRPNGSSHGRNYAEQRYSPLARIDEANVAKLGLAWSFDLASEHGVEATPLVADGVMYVSAPWSIVYALDAATGERLWTFDPEVPRSHARKICCGFVNRGVALWDDRVFVGTLDGRLIAVDRATGKPIWSTSTVEAPWSYSITGAPRVVEGKVVIGNAGADLGARGYVSAYDAQTGELSWRTYTVPGDPAKGFESPAMEKAAKTWTGEWWKSGGGGTVWDGMAYDPDLRPPLRRNGKRHAPRALAAQPRRRRQSLSLVDPRASPRDRRARLALPDDTRRVLGLHLDAAHHAGRSRDRGTPAQGPAACAEERLLLRDRSRDGASSSRPSRSSTSTGRPTTTRTGARSRPRTRTSSTSRASSGRAPTAPTAGPR